jgi:hypothetical protein
MILALFNRDHFDYLSYYICLVEEGLFLACMCLLSISINIPFFIEINAVFLRVNFRSRRSQKPYSPNPVNEDLQV